MREHSQKLYFREGTENEGERQVVGDWSWPPGSRGQLDRARGLGGSAQALPANLRVREQAQRTDQGHLAEAAQSLRPGLEEVPRLRPLR